MAVIDIRNLRSAVAGSVLGRLIAADEVPKRLRVVVDQGIDAGYSR